MIQIGVNEQKGYDIIKFYTNLMNADKHLTFKSKLSIEKGIEFATKELSKLKENKRR